MSDSVSALSTSSSFPICFVSSSIACLRCFICISKKEFLFLRVDGLWLPDITDGLVDGLLGAELCEGPCGSSGEFSGLSFFAFTSLFLLFACNFMRKVAGRVVGMGSGVGSSDGDCTIVASNDGEDPPGMTSIAPFTSIALNLCLNLCFIPELLVPAD